MRNGKILGSHSLDGNLDGQKKLEVMGEKIAERYRWSIQFAKRKCKKVEL